MNKKGYVQDFLVYGIMLFLIAVGSIVGTVIVTEFNTKFQGMDDMSTATKEISSSNADRFSKVFDWAFIMVVFGFAIAIIASLYVLNTHPALFFPVVIVFGIILIAIGIIGNVFDKFSNASSISSTVAEFTMMGWIMDHYVLVVLVFGFAGIIALFAKLDVGP